MEVQLPVVPQSKCAHAYRSHSHLRIDETVLCAGFESGGKDACRVNLLAVLWLGKLCLLILVLNS